MSERPATPDGPGRKALSPVLAAAIGAGGGMRRIFVDALGLSVPMPAALRRLVATDPEVGALALRLGAPLVGCAGDLDPTLDGAAEVAPAGPARAPDPAAVKALRPDLILAGVAGGVHALVDERTTLAMNRIAPVIAVDLARPAAAEADLRALVGHRRR